MVKQTKKTSKPLVAAKPQRSAKKSLKSATKKKKEQTLLVATSSISQKNHSPWYTNLHPMACLYQQGIQMKQEMLEQKWKFEQIDGVVVDLLKEHPDKKLFLALGNEPRYHSTDVSTSVLVPILHIIMVPSTLKQLPPFLRRKAVNGESSEVVDLHSLKLEWKTLPEFGNDRVFGLFCKRVDQTLKNLPLEQQALYEYTLLADCRPSKAFPCKENGDLEVEFASFDVALPNGSVIADVTYDRALVSLSEFITGFIEEHNLNDEHYELVKNKVKEAFAKQRKSKELEMKRVHQGVDNIELLEDIACAKVYPTNFHALFPARDENGDNRVKVVSDHEYGPAAFLF